MIFRAAAQPFVNRDVHYAKHPDWIRYKLGFSYTGLRDQWYLGQERRGLANPRPQLPEGRCIMRVSGRTTVMIRGGYSFIGTEPTDNDRMG